MSATKCKHGTGERWIVGRAHMDAYADLLAACEAALGLVNLACRCQAGSIGSGPCAACRCERQLDSAIAAATGQGE